MEATKIELLANRAMWAGDYRKAIEVCKHFLDISKEQDGLALYKTDFELLYLKTYLRKRS
jgi:hypothetical protein